MTSSRVDVVIVRFWTKVNKRGPIGYHYRTGKSIGRCWIWCGATTDHGYGNVRWLDGRQRSAHRVSYELVVGPIEKPQLDHLCRVRACVNPKHLEPVTSGENRRRCLAGLYWDAIRAGVPAVIVYRRG